MTIEKTMPGESIFEAARRIFGEDARVPCNRSDPLNDAPVVGYIEGILGTYAVVDSKEMDDE